MSRYRATGEVQGRSAAPFESALRAVPPARLNATVLRLEIQSTIIYSDSHLDTVTDLGSEVGPGFWVRLGYAMPDTFDPSHWALRALAAGHSTFGLRYSQDGVGLAQTIDGDETPSGWTSLEDLRNRTDEYGKDSETSKFVTRTVHDGNGLFVETTNTPKTVDDEQRFSMAYDIHFSYVEIESPSKAIAIFNRLHTL